MAKEKSKKGFLKFTLIVLLLLGLGGGWFAWKYILGENVNLGGKKYSFLELPAGSSYEDLKEILASNDLVKNIESFDWYARKMKLNEPANIHPGRYRIVPGMSNRQLVKILKNGKEEKVKLNINYTTRSKEQLIEKLSSKFDMDKGELEEFLSDEVTLDKKYGLNSVSVMTMVRPGEYELSWATGIEQFFDLMKERYKAFWTEARKNKAKEMNMSQSEIMILASVVQGEANIESEQKKIAGVYLNRLEQGIPLQADPTVIFALNDFTIQRVLGDDLKFDSPYNTYKYKGLPPGPICFPSDQAVAAVLNHEKNKCLFFCAKPELNGYSDFSETLEQHEKYAKAYRAAMDKRGIKR
jgi:UPF0755 protein